MPEKLIFGLLERKPRWSLSVRGWLCSVGLICGLGFVVFLGIHPFLAVTHRVDADIMVVEGWVDVSIIHAAVAEFTNRAYRRVFTTGGPVHGSGAYTNDFNTAASVGANLLKTAGLAEDIVQMVPCRVKDRDRTYSAAVALRTWLQTNDVKVQRLNVVTEGVHARRTWQLYREALGPDITVGIIAFPNQEYRAASWWRYSEGVKETLSEGIAYFYARFLFRPK